MKPLMRVLALGVWPLVMVAGVGVVGRQSMPSQGLSLAAAVSTAPCQQPPVFKPGYQLGENYVVSQGEGFLFGGESWVQANLCSAGILKITANGELGGDEDPRLTIIFNATILATPSFNQERTVEVKIPYAGQVYLSFLNDYYLADVRIAILSDVRLEAANCQDFKSVVVPKESVGRWSPETRTAILVYAPPMSLLPCAAGQLTLKVQGREGNKEFPALTFTQGGKVIKSLQTRLNDQTVNLSVSAEPLTIAVNNPYGKTLADRNLNVKRIEFIPGQP